MGCPYANGVAPGAARRARGGSGGGDKAASSSASTSANRAESGLETLTNELVNSLRPTEMSEMRRRSVFEHIKQLAQECFGTSHTLVSAYGSVPLRAYLPDGDIDVCLLGDHRVIDKANWTTKFRRHIEKAEAEADPPHEFAVSEVTVINAEVRLMKCIVDGMMVDVSANQFGGLASLGFLEETNTFIGRDDLFVRSIILVKAWGFYEGRILGAHHALISTYALETLVLYIINKYHAELTCPLSVLHKLLSVFADFEWEKYALTIHGPVPIEEVANAQKVSCLEGGLLTEEFIQSMFATYSCEFMRAAANSAPVSIKYMNIIDPLLPNNNLGRSVSCGNYRRVRAALRLGAKRLDALMASSAACDDVGVLRGFVDMFGNILRHRRLIYPLPHAPDTPGGCSHADEVSMTPLGMPTSAIALRSRSCLVEGTTPATAPATHPHTRSVVDELQPRKLELNDDEGVVTETQNSVSDPWASLGAPLSPERQIKRTESSSSLNGQERGLHWGRWDVLVDEEPVVQRGGTRRSMDEDSAKLSTSPPQSVSSDDNGDQNDSCDVGAESKQSPPIPEDATAPGINDIFTGCLDTIREHLAFGVYHHRRAHERKTQRSAHERRRGNNGNNRSGNRQAHNRARNASRSTEGSSNNAFQPPPPPGAPPPGTVKRGYESDSSGVFGENMRAHFPQFSASKEKRAASSAAGEPPRRSRSPRPSPTFPQAWSGVAKMPASFVSEQSVVGGEPVTMASMLKKDVEEKLRVSAPLADSPPAPETPETVSSATESTATDKSTQRKTATLVNGVQENAPQPPPSWGPKGSAPIDVLKANAAKPVSHERPKTPSLTAEDPLAGAENATHASKDSSRDCAHSEDSAATLDHADAAASADREPPTRAKRVRSRKSKPQAPTVECEETFPTLGAGHVAADAPSTASTAATKSWATLL